MKKVLSHDAVSGITETYQSNHDGTFTIKTSQDAAPFLADNASARSTADSGWKGDFHEVASVPPIVWNLWWKELGDDPGAKRNSKWLIAKLNSSDYLKLRTKEGNI